MSCIDALMIQIFLRLCTILHKFYLRLYNFQKPFLITSMRIEPIIGVFNKVFEHGLTWLVRGLRPPQSLKLAVDLQGRVGVVHLAVLCYNAACSYTRPSCLAAYGLRTRPTTCSIQQVLLELTPHEGVSPLSARPACLSAGGLCRPHIRGKDERIEFLLKQRTR